MESRTEMSLDTPATIVIMGAGPVGLEATLYARYLGYDVRLLEAECVGASLKRWGDRLLPDSFGTLASSLALEALSAQSNSFVPPGEASQLTGIEFLQQFLIPLAESDLVSDCLHCPVRVTSIRLGEIERIELEWEADVPDDGHDHDTEGNDTQDFDTEDHDTEDHDTQDDDNIESTAHPARAAYMDRPTFVVTIESGQGTAETIVAHAVIDVRGRAPQSTVAGASSSANPVCAARPVDDLADADVVRQLGQLYFRIGAVTDAGADLTTFRMSHGRDQIRNVFAQLGGRANLNLYRY